MKTSNLTWFMLV